MYGTPASAAIFATFSAITRACVSLSITHGPAIKKSGFPAPRRSLPSSISRVAPMEFYEDTTHGATLWANAPDPKHGVVGIDSIYALALGEARIAGAGWCSATLIEAGRKRCFLCSSAAPINAANNGCGSSGLDLNS